MREGLRVQPNDDAGALDAGTVGCGNDAHGVALAGAHAARGRRPHLRCARPIRSDALGEVRIKALLQWAEAGKIRPNISHRLPLEDFARAMRLLTDRKAIGRVALLMR